MIWRKPITPRILLNVKPWTFVQFYAENVDIYTEYLNTKWMNRRYMPEK